MLDIIKILKNMVKVLKTIPMEINTKENLNKEKETVMAFILIQMEANMRVNIEIINSMESAQKSSKTEINIKESTKMVKEMDTEYTLRKMASSIRV